MELKLINLELKFATKKLNPQINLPFNLLIQKYFFHNNPTWSRYLKWVLGVVPTYGKKNSYLFPQKTANNYTLKYSINRVGLIS